ncbi:MAG: hypothetical protein GX776_10025 [Oxalobacter sp.]|nr:hypothetical protein [Oxalobacter sp.]
MGTDEIEKVFADGFLLDLLKLDITYFSGECHIGFTCAIGLGVKDLGGPAISSLFAVKEEKRAVGNEIKFGAWCPG